ncbi:hypothetical protein ILUMI_20882 [Ignelater luminosus]|uniref:Uncharacterized protein n=1 Tax=Ignelater luminosus TaxID=2038154 RepID=A0A8K0CDI4_IGNLU|nr:hypothetical protein ILUMI_20882 [Ignelater luminosus]
MDDVYVPWDNQKTTHLICIPEHIEVYVCKARTLFENLEATGQVRHWYCLSLKDIQGSLDKKQRLLEDDDENGNDYVDFSLSELEYIPSDDHTRDGSPAKESDMNATKDDEPTQPPEPTNNGTQGAPISNNSDLIVWGSPSENFVPKHSIPEHFELEVRVPISELGLLTSEGRLALLTRGRLPCWDSLSAPVTEAAMGCALAMQCKPGKVIQAVKDVIGVGYRNFDYAHVYQNEKKVRITIPGKIAEGVVKQIVEFALRRTLIELGLDYLDFYILHWPMGFKEGDDLFPNGVNDADVFWRILIDGRIDLDHNKPVFKIPNYRITENDDIQIQLKKVSTLEKVEIKSSWSIKEQECENRFIKTTKWFEGGRFEVSIPLKEALEKLDDSFEQAQNRFDTHHLAVDKGYNCDETGVAVNAKEFSKIKAKCGRRQVGALSSGNRGKTLTIEIYFTAAGNYVPPMLIFPQSLPSISRAKRAKKATPPPSSSSESDERVEKDECLYSDDYSVGWIRCSSCMK